MKMMNLMHKSGMSDGDERSYPVFSAKNIIAWSLSFSVEIVLKRQDCRYIFVRSLLQKTALVFCRFALDNRPSILEKSNPKVLTDWELRAVAAV